ncbi:GntR family transcriptional regulator [Szabonella alba]|uniref:GntR family transcriptional regulator n=1 Tax=Szabonella alba TaxID=2804194 RepID=A0A8K0VED4_9RHOB|nr:GntR family transcriptional regulator [Szabonella alba]MBL4918688.1 GntR family transcriptional regulator [Szabonella alba]
MSDTPVLQPLAPRHSLGEEVHGLLLARLMSSVIPPGERIAIDTLARDLGVSQTPIRAALTRLEAEGLVLRRHNAGFSAAPLPSAERTRQLYEFRLLLEPEAAAMATRTRQPGLLEDLRATLTEMEASLSDIAAGQGRFALADLRFHDRVASGSGNEVIAEALGRLRQPMQMFRLRFAPDVQDRAIREHGLIVDRMAAGDDRGAAEAMRAHIAEGQRRFEPFYRELR